MLHLCDFLINVWHLPPKTGALQGQEHLGVHHCVISAECVLASAWLTLMSSRNEMKQQKVNHGKGVG